MANTVTSAFQNFKTNIEISNLQKETVSARQRNVRTVIEREMQVVDSFLTGSYSRSTLIVPLSGADIDIFIVLNSQYYEKNGCASLLDRVRRVLLKAYEAPKISRNGQAVTMTFEDFVVDVVPAFHRKGGGYLIPNSIEKLWIATNPKTHVELMIKQNAIHNGDLVPIVKMIKAWNKNINDAFVSFYLELLAAKIFNGVTISDYPSGVRFFFGKGCEAIKYMIKDPVEYGGQVGGFRTCKTVSEATNQFETAYQHAINAERYANSFNIAQALNEWKKIFGSKFPAYG